MASRRSGTPARTASRPQLRLRPTARRRGVRAICVAALLLASPAAGDAGPAAARVGQLHDVLLDVMQRAETLGFDGRAELLAPALKDYFDLAYMAQLAAGRYWRELSEADRARMVDAFTRMTIATYASRFDGFDGQRFEVLGEEASAHETRLVRSRVVSPSDDPVELTYRLRANSETWRIIDVFLKGTVSELALRRSEYASVIKRDGFEGLLEALEKKIRELEAGGEAP